MGRPRTKNRHLPERVYLLRGGTYYFIPKDGSAVRLGRTFGEAMEAYGRLDVARPAGTTMGDVIDRYTREVAPAKANARKLVAQLGKLRQAFGHMPPDTIKARHVYAYLDARGKAAPVAANREVALLSAVFTKAIRWGYVERNPCLGVERLEERPRTRYVTDEEFRAVYAIAPPAIQIAMDLALLTGQRQGDVLGLQLGNLSERGIHFHQGKTGKEVIVAWDDELRAVVERAKGLRRNVRSLWLITNERARPYTSSGFQTAWQRLMRAHAEAGGRRFTFHDLRAKNASDEPDAVEASRRLGHGNPSTTQRAYQRRASVVRPLKY